MLVGNGRKAAVTVSVTPALVVTLPLAVAMKRYLSPFSAGVALAIPRVEVVTPL